MQSGRIAVPTDGTEAAQGSTAGEYAPAAVHGAIAEKIGATSALLTDEQRGRITALVPMFACAALDNDPDVVAMVVRWMDLSPDNIAHEMVANLDALERRFEQ